MTPDQLGELGVDYTSAGLRFVGVIDAVVLQDKVKLLRVPPSLSEVEDVLFQLFLELMKYVLREANYQCPQIFIFTIAEVRNPSLTGADQDWRPWRPIIRRLSRLKKLKVLIGDDDSREWSLEMEERGDDEERPSLFTDGRPVLRAQCSPEKEGDPVVGAAAAAGADAAGVVADVVAGGADSDDDSDDEDKGGQQPRLRAEKAAKQEKPAAKDDAFVALQAKVRTMLLDTNAFIEYATKDALVTYTRYLFQATDSATDSAGWRKVTASRDAMLINLINRVGIPTLLQYVKDPPKYSAEDDAMAHLPKLYVPGKDGADDGKYEMFSEQSGFEEMDMLVSNNARAMLAPAWLPEALEFRSHAGYKLCSETILYKFGEGGGGWAAAPIAMQLDDANDTVTVETDDGEEEERPRNFAVKYDDGIIKLLLTVANYATSHDDPPGSWVIVRGRTKAKGKAKAKAGLARGGADDDDDDDDDDEEEEEEEGGGGSSSSNGGRGGGGSSSSNGGRGGRPGGGDGARGGADGGREGSHGGKKVGARKRATADSSDEEGAHLPGYEPHRVGGGKRVARVPAGGGRGRSRGGNASATKRATADSSDEEGAHLPGYEPHREGGGKRVARGGGKGAAVVAPAATVGAGGKRVARGGGKGAAVVAPAATVGAEGDGDSALILYNEEYAQAAVGSARWNRSFIMMSDHVSRTGCGLCCAPLVESDYTTATRREQVCSICGEHIEHIRTSSFMCPFGHSVIVCSPCSGTAAFAVPCEAKRDGAQRHLTFEYRPWASASTIKRKQALELCGKQFPHLSEKDILDCLAPPASYQNEVRQDDVWLFLASR